MTLLISEMRLRSVKSGDTEGLINLMTDPKVRKYLGGPISESSARVKAKHYLELSFEYLKVIEVSGKFAGFITLTQHCDEPGTEVSYQLHPKFTGKGYAYLALKKVINEVAPPLVAETQVANVKSRSLLNKLGFNEEKFCKRHGEDQVIAVLRF